MSAGNNGRSGNGAGNGPDKRSGDQPKANRRADAGPGRRDAGDTLQDWGDTVPGPAEFERDAHLRLALLHAPDADASAPASLSEHILREARQVATTAAAHRQAKPSPAMPAPRARARTGVQQSSWSSFWAWLVQPAVAGSFASLMVATLVGVMWWGQPIDAPLREEARAPESAAPAPAPATAAMPAQTPAAAPAIAGVGSNDPTATDSVVRPNAAPAARADEALVAAAPVAGPTVPSAAKPAAALKNETASAERRQREVALAESVARDSLLRSLPKAEESTGRVAAPAAMAGTDKAAAPPPAAPPLTGTPTGAAVAAAPAAVAPGSPPLERKQDDSVARNTSPADTRSADAAAPQAADLARPTLVAKSAARAAPAIDGAGASASASPEGVAQARVGAAGESTERREQMSTNTADRFRAEAEAATDSPPTDNPLSRVRAAVAAWPEVWTWQRSGSGEQPMNATVQAWLGQAEQATGAGWRASQTSAGGAQTLLLLRNGRLHTTVRVEANAVHVATAGARAARASVPGSAAAALRASMPQAAP